MFEQLRCFTVFTQSNGFQLTKIRANKERPMEKRFPLIEPKVTSEPPQSDPVQSGSHSGPKPIISFKVGAAQVIVETQRNPL